MPSPVRSMAHWTVRATLALVAVLFCLAPASASAQQQLVSQRSAYIIRLASAPDVASAPTALRQPISLMLHQVTVGRALREIRERAGINLTYSGAVVPLDRVVSVDVENGSVLEALHQVLRGTDVELWVSAAGRMAIVPADRTPAANAQAAAVGAITGLVTAGGSGEPLPGVAILVSGTRSRAVTQSDGRYSIPGVPEGEHTVYARHIGFSPDSQRVVVSTDQTATANFVLQAVRLGEVVVVGYGEQEARDRTGVVETVTSEEFNTGRVISPEQLIQAKVAGVQVVDNGEPGGGGSVRIRGGTSVNASNEPLFVIDGVPLAVGGGVSNGRNPLNFLNPGDIETITVLKDASATAIYGSRGANGVILVTTRSGAGGRGFTYTSSFSGSTITNEPDLLNAEQFRAAVAQYAPENMGRLGNASTDWRDAVQRSAAGREHSLAFAGNREDMNYRLSLGYLDQDGVIQATTLKRLTGSLNYSDRLFNDRLRLSTNVKGSRTEDWFTPGSVIGAATSFAPTQPIRGTSGEYFEWNSPILGPNNPLAELALVSDRGTAYRSVGKVEGEYRLPFVEELAATLRLGYDVTKAERTGFFPSTLESQSETSRFGTFTRNSPSQANTVLEAFANHKRTFARYASEIDATAGYSYERSTGDYPSFYAESLSSDLLGRNGIPASKVQRTFLTVDESRLASFFGRINYSLRDRYLLTLSVRRDGSSKFGPSEQWGTFPSAAVAWRIIDEPFLNGVSALSDLKLRLSWGVNGNQAFANYQAFSSYEIGGSTAQTQFGNGFVATIRPSAADPGIKWEETTSYNVGADYGFLDDRISGAIEYYVKKTADLIFEVPVAAGTNLSNYVTTNVGDMENRGLEFTVSTTLFSLPSRGFTWDASFNASTNRNRLVRVNPFGGGEQILVGGIAGGVGSNIQVLQPGQPVNSFFVYRHKRRADGRPVYEDANGDGNITDIDLYEDLNGDGEISQSDRAPFKSPTPKWIFGHTSQMGYRNFDLGFTLRAYRGNYVYNNVASNLGNYRELTGIAPSNLHASVLRNGFVNPQYFSDVYVEDASFVRMDNITLGYTFPRLRAVSQLRVFGTIQNVFTITDYTGVDPLAGVNGIDNNIYPYSRTVTAGLSVGL